MQCLFLLAETLYTCRNLIIGLQVRPRLYVITCASQAFLLHRSPAVSLSALRAQEGFVPTSGSTAKGSEVKDSNFFVVPKFGTFPTNLFRNLCRRGKLIQAVKTTILQVGGMTSNGPWMSGNLNLCGSGMLGKVFRGMTSNGP